MNYWHGIGRFSTGSWQVVSSAYRDGYVRQPIISDVRPNTICTYTPMESGSRKHMLFLLCVSMLNNGVVVSFMQTVFIILLKIDKTHKPEF